MELQFFDWTTNPDYADMLSRPIITNIVKIRMSEEKRIRAKKKRKKKNILKRKHK